MRSCLTRRVFRRILLDQPITQKCHRHTRSIHYHCGRAGNTRPAIRNGHALFVPGPVPRRTFFGLFEAPEREAVALRLDPGIEKMLELDKRIHLKARLPPKADLAKALDEFFSAKGGRNRIIEDFHASLLLQTLQVMKASESVDTGDLSTSTEPLISSASLCRYLTALGNSHSQLTETHALLAEELYTQLVSSGSFRLPDKTSDPLFAYASVLCRSGRTLKAREEIERVQKDGENTSQSAEVGDSWRLVLLGFTKEKNKQEFEATLETMQRFAIPLTESICEAAAVFYAIQNDVANTKKWCPEKATGIQASNPESHSFLGADTYEEILGFCIRNGEMAWGQTVLAGHSEKPPTRWEWEAIFGAAASSGRSVEQINDMVAVAVRRTQEARPKQRKGSQAPDIGIYNALIRTAVSKNDSYTAERYFQLLEKWKATPNATTYILQIEYRLAVRDLGGAMAAYEELTGFDVPHGADWPITNRLLQILVSSPNIKEETISRVIDNVSARKFVLFSDTVAALCKYHLEREEYFEIVDLLHTYSFQFSISQRVQIRDILSSYTLDPSTETSRAWDSYMIFQKIFDMETHRDICNEVMTSFFRRKRDDLAMHVFLRMSKHMRADTRPDIETYTRAFEGIALTAQIEALTQVHNLLKLDTDNEPCTRVLNAMMLAYTACDEALISLEIWREISTSAEGPDLNSLNIALRACEKAPYGWEVAEEIWDNIQMADVLIDKTLLLNYLAALLPGEFFDKVKDGVFTMKEVTGEDPDATTMGILYNACMNPYHQEMLVDTLIKPHYPHFWAELEARGFEEDFSGTPRVKGIDRTLKA